MNVAVVAATVGLDAKALTRLLGVTWRNNPTKSWINRMWWPGQKPTNFYGLPAAGTDL